MRILIVTPLFPPDTPAAATYTKELARRLSKKHEVTVLLYGYLPETIPGVQLINIDKRRAAPLRLWSFMQRLTGQSALADIVIIQNGPSVELPCFFSLRFKRKPVILMESDAAALVRTQKKPNFQYIHQQLRQRITATFSRNEPWPLERPVVHPLMPYPEREFAAWEESWKQHLTQLDTLFNKHHV
jgi:glycosyltransferase involved in cell wall biosynthesis